MALALPPYSSSDSSKPYDVFISFSGKDTRGGFTSHLYAALSRKDIETFKDDRELKKGDEMSPALQRSIQESRISVVIFSNNYASSTWCLDELKLILQCHKSHGQILIPVFYGIDPSHVRKQQGSYATSFCELKRRFKDIPDKVQEWRDALQEAGSRSGWDSTVTRPESELVEKIVADIGIKLGRYWSSDEPELVGNSELIEKMEKSLLLDTKKSLQEAHIVGIWGMKGIGKTTLAAAVFKRISGRFSQFCFLEDVTAKYHKDGPVHLRKTLLESLEKEKINIPCKLKLLIVLDDVNSAEQYTILLRSRNSRIDLDANCRIIVTTTDKRVLESIRANEIFEVEKLSEKDALRLFHLFVNPKENSGTENYKKLSRKVVNYAERNPWALKVFASYLCSRNEKEWEIANSVKLEKIPIHEKIYKFLRKVYDELDESLKQNYLDIACFFQGENRDFVERILDMSRLSMNDLIAKSLVAIKDSNKLWVHSLLQQMVSKTCGDHMSRLWKADDVYYVLRTNTTGTENIEGIFLNMSELNGEIQLRRDVFCNMRNLRLLKLYDSGPVKVCKVFLPQGLESLPHKSLTYLHWHGYPLKSFPQNFTPNNLIELNLPRSQVKKLWEEVKLDKLKNIDLSYSEHLTDFPNLSQAPNVESISLEQCISLPEVPSYVQDLEKLKSLNLKGCSSLVNLFTCSNLTISEIARCSHHLAYLMLDGTAIKQLPESVGKLNGLQVLSLNMCKNLESLPNNISMLNSLQSLGLLGCSKLKILPELPPSFPLVDATRCNKLKTVSRSSALEQDLGDLNHNGQKFVFWNCLDLEENALHNIMIDAHVRLLRTAILTSKCGKGDADTNEICFPGNEIPKCLFTDLSDGPSTNIDFLPNWCDTNFLGVAFCVIVYFNKCQLDGDFKLTCQSSCIKSNMKTVDWRRSWTWHWNHSDHDTAGTENTIKSAHAFLFYDYTCHEYFRNEANWPVSTSQQIVHSATFEFYPEDSGGFLDSCNCRVLKCGVRPLYAKNAKQFGFKVEHVEEEDRRMISSSIEQNVGFSMRINSTSCITKQPEPSGARVDVHSDIMMEEEGQTSSPYCLVLCSQIKDILDCIRSKRSEDVESLYRRKDHHRHRGGTSSDQLDIMTIHRRFQGVDEVLQKYQQDIRTLTLTNQKVLEYLKVIIDDIRVRETTVTQA